MVEGDIEGVEAIDLDSGGEARNMPQWWTGAAGLVRHCGARLIWCLDLKSKGFFFQLCVILLVGVVICDREC